MSPRPPHSDAPLHALAISAALACSVALIALLGPGRLADYASALAFNACAIGWLWLALVLLSRALGRPRWPGVALGALLIGAITMVFAHGWFFDVASERRLTLLDLTLGGLGYFFSVALPRSGLLAYAAMLGATALGSWGLARWLGPLSRRGVALAGALLLALTGGVLSAPRIASPLFDSCQELYRLASLPRVRPAPAAHAEPLTAWLDKSARTRAAAPVQYAKVIVLVMETMTAATFEAQRAALPAQSFLQRERAHLHAFTRYYPNNQDSRTGMLDMLFARLIPYEAYSDAGYAGYRHLAAMPSLVDRMRALSYASAFAVSQTALEDVVGELPWDATLRLSAAQIEAAREAGKLCFTPDEWEQSCEDLVLLPQVVDFIASHERAFVYQEFIWGHASEYNEASGKTNAAYYSAYLDALREALAARGLADDTLIALTSDHGFRDKGRQDDPEVYRVPLLFHAPRLAPRTDARLLSHSDFGMLLFEQLSPAAPRADDNPFVMIVGPTGQGHTFVVGRGGGHLLLWQRAGRDLRLARAGDLGFAPELMLATFQRYKAQFDRGRAPP